MVRAGWPTWSDSRCDGVEFTGVGGAGGEPLGVHEMGRQVEHLGGLGLAAVPVDLADPHAGHHVGGQRGQRGPGELQVRMGGEQVLGDRGESGVVASVAGDHEDLPPAVPVKAVGVLADHRGQGGGRQGHGAREGEVVR